jgi:bifunctional oligoribonuclease and PAP phosphatase NrnA
MFPENNMPLNWTPLVELFRKSEQPLLMTHIRPDADGLGSQLAVADALRAMGKKPRVVVASKLPPRYDFLDPEKNIIELFNPNATEQFKDCDAIVILDTGTWGQLGDFCAYLKEFKGPKAVVDHHQTQDDLGGIALVDTSAEATGRLAYEIINALNMPISSYAANMMFMAIALDTGWFRHSNTTAKTFELCTELVKAGANPTPLYEKLFEAAPIARLKLAGKALERLQTRSKGLVAWTEIFLKDYSDTQSVPGDTEDLINYPRSVDGVEVAMIFIEQFDGGTKVSFRARSKVNVAELAATFGGGGHKLASGARLAKPLPEARDIVIAAVEKALAAC